jgi:DNA-binding Lrp family transcriptional regulator
MSGGYDIAVTITGKTFKDVALFVAHRLSPIEEVRSTATSFVLRKYKERGCSLMETEKDGREANL